ncbi:MAG TPA: hypothetical protein VK850_17020 [Candidatus Binatia bacterium]|nr:hypothetical protein [Candidatus Binatia bacterium]
MRVWLLVLMVVALSTAGCKTKKVEAHPPPPAYADPAAMQEAVRQAQMIVQVRGDVRNHVIPWSDNLTLAGALVEADYMGRMDPLSVTVTRVRKIYRFSASRLLSGADMFLEPGDVIDIHR